MEDKSNVDTYLSLHLKEAADFKQRIHTLTIDQLIHEQQLTEDSINNFKKQFSSGKLSDKKDKYASLCQAHQDLFGGDFGRLDMIKTDYNHLHSSHSLLQSQLSQLDTK